LLDWRDMVAEAVAEEEKEEAAVADEVEAEVSARDASVAAVDEADRMTLVVAVAVVMVIDKRPLSGLSTTVGDAAAGKDRDEEMAEKCKDEAVGALKVDGAEVETCGVDEAVEEDD
jgi:hypothetical protein